MEQRPLDDELRLLRVQASVPPTLEWLVEDFLVDALVREAGDALVAEPIAYTLDSAALTRYEGRVLVR